MTRETTAIFKQTALFGDLEEKALRTLARGATEKHLGRNEILFLAGERAAGLYVIAAGAVRAFRTAADGREQIIHVERAVTTIAEVPVFDDGAYPSTVAAEEPTTVFFLAKEKVLAACFEHPEIALAAARLLSARLRRCAALAESLSLREVGQRLAHFLLTEAAQNGVPYADGARLKLKFTHNQLAARIGTVREVVTRVFLRLQQQGLVALRGKDLFIPDLHALAVYSATDNA